MFAHYYLRRSRAPGAAHSDVPRWQVGELALPYGGYVTDGMQVRRRISARRMAARWALAVLVAIVAGSLHDTGIHDVFTQMLALLGIGLLVWAIVGLFPHRVDESPRTTEGT